MAGWRLTGGKKDGEVRVTKIERLQTFDLEKNIFNLPKREHRSWNVGGNSRSDTLKNAVQEFYLNQP